jgi:hypothetical protein
MNLFETNTTYVIELSDQYDTWEYKGWSDQVLTFETVAIAEERIHWIFRNDTSINEARIIRVEKTPVKQIINNDAWQSVVD